MVLEIIFIFLGMSAILRNLYVILLTHFQGQDKVRYTILSILFLTSSVLFALEKGFVLFSLIVILSFALPRLSRYLSASKTKKIFVNCLDIIILKMKSGQSFSNAFKSVCADSDPFIKQKLFNIWNILEYWDENKSSSLTGFDREVVLRLHSIMSSSSHYLNQLCGFRDELRLRLRFQNKTNKMALQTRMQSVVLILIYIVIAVVVSSTYGFQMVKPWLLVSIPLMLIGIMWLISIPKRFRWNI